MRRPVRRRAARIRWKCRDCGNSAMFVEERPSTSQRLIAWGGRDYGYAPLGEFFTHKVEPADSSTPAHCWVCGGRNIGFARRLRGEADDGPDETIDPSELVLDAAQRRPRGSALPPGTDIPAAPEDNDAED